MRKRRTAHRFGDKRRTGDVLTAEKVDFCGLMLSSAVLEGLKSAGFERPSPIQLKAIPLGRCGLDLIAQAKSGTGKTCVFSVIALENINLAVNSIQVLVLAPTREIAVQIKDVVRSIGRHMTGLHVEVFIGGMPIEEDKRCLKQCHIAIGTPGRIKHLIENKFLKTESIRLFILDEADKLLDESFQNQTNWIYSTLPVSKQMLALSATYTDHLAENLRKYMKEPTFVRLNATDPALEGIRHYRSVVPYHSLPHKVFQEKVKSLLHLLSKLPFHQCLIFSNYQIRARNLSETLAKNGWPSTYISGSQGQNERLKAMEKLKEFKCRILISTDLTSRGIDAERVNLVVCMDVPRDSETYLHRVGRAGRFGSYGAAINFVADGKEMTDLDEIEAGCGVSIEPLPDDLSQLLMESMTSDAQHSEHIVMTHLKSANSDTSGSQACGTSCKTSKQNHLDDEIENEHKGKERVGKETTEHMGREMLKDHVGKEHLGKVSVGNVGGEVGTGMGVEYVGNDEAVEHVDKEVGIEGVGMVGMRHVGEEVGMEHVGKEVGMEHVGKEVGMEHVGKEVGMKHVGKEVEIVVDEHDEVKHVGKEVGIDHVGKEVGREHAVKEVGMEHMDNGVGMKHVTKKPVMEHVAKSEKMGNVEKIVVIEHVGKKMRIEDIPKEAAMVSAGKEVEMEHWRMEGKIEHSDKKIETDDANARRTNNGMAMVNIGEVCRDEFTNLSKKENEKGISEVRKVPVTEEEVDKRVFHVDREEGSFSYVLQEKREFRKTTNFVEGVVYEEKPCNDERLGESLDHEGICIDTIDKTGSLKNYVDHLGILDDRHGDEGSSACQKRSEKAGCVGKSNGYLGNSESKVNGDEHLPENKDGQLERHFGNTVFDEKHTRLCRVKEHHVSKLCDTGEHLGELWGSEEHSECHAEEHLGQHCGIEGHVGKRNHGKYVREQYNGTKRFPNNCDSRSSEIWTNGKICPKIHDGLRQCNDTRTSEQQIEVAIPRELTAVLKFPEGKSSEETIPSKSSADLQNDGEQMDQKNFDKEWNFEKLDGNSHHNQNRADLEEASAVPAGCLSNSKAQKNPVIFRRIPTQDCFVDLQTNEFLNDRSDSECSSYGETDSYSSVDEKLRDVEGVQISKEDFDVALDAYLEANTRGKPRSVEQYSDETFQINIPKSKESQPSARPLLREKSEMSRSTTGINQESESQTSDVSSFDGSAEQATEETSSKPCEFQETGQYSDNNTFHGGSAADVSAYLLSLPTEWKHVWYREYYRQTKLISTYTKLYHNTFY